MHVWRDACVVWCGVVWCDVVWCGVMRCDVVLCCVVLCCVVLCCVVLCDGVELRPAVFFVFLYVFYMCCELLR